MARKKPARRRALRKASPPAEHTRTFHAQPEAAEHALEELMQSVEQADFSCGDPAEIRLAMREALNNAIRHGSNLDPNKRIQLTYRCDPRDGLWVMIRDEGGGFDPAKVPDPTTPENLDRPGGRGVFLMRNLMDEVEFREGGREVHLRRRPRP